MTQDCIDYTYSVLKHVFVFFSFSSSIKFILKKIIVLQRITVL